jgi:hypothetical protein
MLLDFLLQIPSLCSDDERDYLRAISSGGEDPGSISFTPFWTSDLGDSLDSEPVPIKEKSRTVHRKNLLFKVEEFDRDSKPIAVLGKRSRTIDPSGSRKRKQSTTQPPVPAVDANLVSLSTQVTSDVSAEATLPVSTNTPSTTLPSDGAQVSCAPALETNHHFPEPSDAKSTQPVSISTGSISPVTLAPVSKAVESRSSGDSSLNALKEFPSDVCGIFLRL